MKLCSSQTFHIGVDVSYEESSNSTAKKWECIAKAPYWAPWTYTSWASLRAWDGINEYNNNLSDTISQAASANITEIHLSTFFCPNCTNNDVNYGVPFFLSSLQRNQISYSRIWIAVENRPGSWLDPTTNCNYITSVYKALSSSINAPIGFYSSKSSWNTVFANVCNNFSKAPLWYQDINDNPHFNDQSKYQFGGWRSPFAHQWVYDKSCKMNVGVDNYITM